MLAALHPPLSLADQVWFENLWKEIHIHYPGNGTIRNPPWTRSLRGFTSDEWQKILQLVQQFHLPCTMSAWCYGFAVQIYNHPANTAELPMLIGFVDNQIPEPYKDSKIIADNLTHKAENAALLAHYGFEPLKAHWEYDY